MRGYLSAGRTSSYLLTELDLVAVDFLVLQYAPEVQESDLGCHVAEQG